MGEGRFGQNPDDRKPTRLAQIQGEAYRVGGSSDRNQPPTESGLPAGGSEFRTMPDRSGGQALRKADSRRTTGTQVSADIFDRLAGNQETSNTQTSVDQVGTQPVSKSEATQAPETKKLSAVQRLIRFLK